MFSCDPIPGNVNLHARDIHGEPYYDIPALTADQRFRDSMRLIRQYSLLPFMTLRQFFYRWVVLEFYHPMTYWGVPSPLEIWFSISGYPGVLQAADITATLGLPVVLANSTYYRRRPQPSQREWFALSLEIPRLGLYSSAGSFPHKCSSWTTYSGPAYSHFSISYSTGGLYSRLCIGYPRDSGSVSPSSS